MAAKSVKTLELRYLMTQMYYLGVHFIPWIAIYPLDKLIRSVNLRSGVLFFGERESRRSGEGKKKSSLLPQDEM